MQQPGTRFVGRETEKAELATLLAGHRLVTLVGPGGCGKTRLAIEITRETPGPTTFVDLSDIRDPALIGPLLDGVVDELEKPVALLLLDNCEQVLESVREKVDYILGAYADVKVIATSREPLRVQGEQVWPVPPLSAEESVELFVERARLGAAAFSLTADNAGTVAELCRSLDGLPLGIELAATWAPLIGVDGIRRRMSERLDLLAGSPSAQAPRHYNLRAAIDWSDGLLDGPERSLWYRLAVFAPLFDLDAVERVCATGDISRSSAPHLLRRLIERSLVQPQSDGGGLTRYRLLDIVRDYCFDHLRASGELDRIRETHARYYVELAEEAFSHRDAADLTVWAERMTLDHGNIRAALDWARINDREAELQLAGAMGWVWGARKLLAEGRRLLETAIAGSASETRFGARAYRAAGILALEQGDKPVARARMKRALELHEAQGDEAGQAIVLARLGMLDPATSTARTTLERAAELAERTRERAALVVALANLGALDLKRGSPRSARERYERAAAVSREMGQMRWLPQVLEGLAQACLSDRDVDAARTASAEAVKLAARSHLTAIVPSCLETMAEVAAASEMPDRALRLAGAAEAMRKTSTAAPHDWPESLQNAMARARRSLPGAADALLDEGAAMTIAEAVELATAAADPPLPPSAVRVSRRQAQVAALVAEGLTNAQIAARLKISERTAEWHVEELRNRLGFSSRTQVAAWAARQGLERA